MGSPPPCPGPGPHTQPRATPPAPGRLLAHRVLLLGQAEPLQRRHLQLLLVGDGGERDADGEHGEREQRLRRREEKRSSRNPGSFAAEPARPQHLLKARRRARSGGGVAGAQRPGRGVAGASRRSSLVEAGPRPPGRRAREILSCAAGLRHKDLPPSPAPTSTESAPAPGRAGARGAGTVLGWRAAPRLESTRGAGTRGRCRRGGCRGWRDPAGRWDTSPSPSLASLVWVTGGSWGVRLGPQFQNHPGPGFLKVRGPRGEGFKRGFPLKMKIKRAIRGKPSNPLKGYGDDLGGSVRPWSPCVPPVLEIAGRAKKKEKKEFQKVQGMITSHTFILRLAGRPIVGRRV